MKQPRERGELLTSGEIGNQLLIKTVLKQLFGNALVDRTKNKFIELAARVDHRGGKSLFATDFDVGAFWLFDAERLREPCAGSIVNTKQFKPLRAASTPSAADTDVLPTPPVPAQISTLCDFSKSITAHPLRGESPGDAPSRARSLQTATAMSPLANHASEFVRARLPVDPSRGPRTPRNHAPQRA